MFRLHLLLVDILSKIRQVINKVIGGQKKSGKNPIKDVYFDTQSLANQLYSF